MVFLYDLISLTNSSPCANEEGSLAPASQHMSVQNVWRHRSVGVSAWGPLVSHGIGKQ